MPAPAKRAKKKIAVVKEMTPKQFRDMINKEMGEGTMVLASHPSLRIVRIGTGVLSMDDVTGGGYARNRYVEAYGPESVGKSALALYAVAQCQREGGRAAWIEAEKSFDPVFASNIGVNIKRLDFHKQKSGEKCFNFIEALLRAGMHDLIVVDSIAALIPLSEIDRNMGEGTYGTQQAKMMSEALRRLTVANEKSVIFFINQTRESIGASMFGPKMTTSGGRAMRHYSGIRLEVVRTETLTRPGKKHKANGELVTGNVPVGHRVLVKVIKDKTGGAYQGKEGTFVFRYATAQIDHVDDLITLGREKNLVHVDSKNRFYVEGFEDERIHSRPKFKKWLRNNAAVSEELEEKIRETIGRAAAEEDDEAEDG